MPQIEVARPFVLTTQAGDVKNYQPGVYDVEPEIADHWFTKAHLKTDDNPANVVRHPHEGDTSAAGLTVEPTVQAAQAAAVSSKTTPISEPLETNEFTGKTKKSSS